LVKKHYTGETTMKYAVYFQDKETKEWHWIADFKDGSEVVWYLENKTGVPLNGFQIATELHKNHTFIINKVPDNAIWYGSDFYKIEVVAECTNY
jgi:hypothetical protein